MEGECEKGEKYMMLLRLPACQRESYCEYQKDAPPISYEGEAVNIVYCSKILNGKSAVEVLKSLPVVGIGGLEDLT